eukprot:3173764-Pleurochrysis_carterae.AAC.1
MAATEAAAAAAPRHCVTHDVCGNGAVLKRILSPGDVRSCTPTPPCVAKLRYECTRLADGAALHAPRVCEVTLGDSQLPRGLEKALFTMHANELAEVDCIGSYALHADGRGDEELVRSGDIARGARANVAGESSADAGEDAAGDATFGSPASSTACLRFKVQLISWAAPRKMRCEVSFEERFEEVPHTLAPPTQPRLRTHTATPAHTYSHACAHTQSSLCMHTATPAHTYSHACAHTQPS